MSTPQMSPASEIDQLTHDWHHALERQANEASDSADRAEEEAWNALARALEGASQ